MVEKKFIAVSKGQRNSPVYFERAFKIGAVVAAGCTPDISQAFVGSVDDWVGIAGEVTGGIYDRFSFQEVL